MTTVERTATATNGRVAPAPLPKEKAALQAPVQPEYKVIKNRIHKRVVSKDGVSYAPLCNFEARIVADVTRDDGKMVDHYLAITGKLYDGKPLPEIVIKASEFSSMTWAVGQWGGRVAIEPGRDTRDTLRHAIQTLSLNSISPRRIYTHTGWREIDGKQVYLHGGGAIGADDVCVELPEDLKNYVLPNDDTVDELTAMRASIGLLDIAPARVSAPLWAAMYAGPLTEFITPAFTLWVEGQSGSLKTSYAAVMLNHFGPKFSENAMPADWLNTANNLEKLSFHTKDAPIVIDDYRPASDKREYNAMHEAAKRITRAAGNRKGRGRLSGESEFKLTYPPRGVVISTAERNTSGMSTLSRLLTVIVEPDDIDAKKLATAQRQRRIYGYAMAGFIRYIAQHWDNLHVRLVESVAQERESIGNGNQHKRLPNAAAVLKVAFDLALEYAESIGAITAMERERRSTECQRVLQDTAEEQDRATKAQDPALRFMTTLVTLLAQKKAQITDKETEKQSGIGGPSGEIIGWRWKGRVHLLPAAYKTVYEYCEREGAMLSSDPITLARELVAKGFIVERGRDEIQMSRRGLDGVKAKVYVIGNEKLFEVAAEMGLLHTDLEFVVEAEATGTGGKL